MRWSVPDLADVVEAGLRAQSADDDAEQSVYGFDARDELGLHPVVQQAFTRVGFGVWPEQRYPGHWHKKSKAEGLRCDVVLTPDGLPLRDPDVKGTLFGGQPATDADQAYWLEIKTVAQFETSGPFRRYSSELLQPVTKDVKKIWSDGVIRFGGLLLILFTANQEVAEHDLAAWHTRCIDKGYPVGPPAVRGFPITDRIGNGWCAAAVFGVRGV
ncbi:hypothetical protein [Algisphaera agarilytica]|uniref:Uncharacterized protein n=1 Tax=Algisphaera agarilytica TaxID=1385975 RepID=A0A7X0H817_9BACT|nr:hypothetical protein [Algisphaera agarilytica]MBB6430798.1 hypothetical protein [Algisphaera agarilytica]